MKKVQEWTKEQGVIPSGFAALQEDKDTHSLRHSEQSLNVEAQVIKAKVGGERRGREGGERRGGRVGRGGKGRVEGRRKREGGWGE